MTQKIYFIEDDPVIRQVVTDYLAQWDLECVAPQDFQQIVAEFQVLQPALVLLDISLPYFNGFYWCQEIRKNSEVPIIFLSSAEDKMNQIMAMNMGADDFVAKPFDLALLLAKIQALLRRSYQYGNQAPEFSIGEAVFYPLENMLRQGKDVLPLSPNEARILALLCQQTGQIIPREKIIEHLWQSDQFIDNNTLAVNITRLRKKLASFGLEDIIQTVKNKGYLLEEGT